MRGRRLCPYKIFILLLFFTACVNGYRHGTIEVAVAEGTIAQPGGGVVAAHSFETVPVRRDNIQRIVDLSVTGGFIIQQPLSFVTSGGEFTNIIDSPVGTRVSEGDILATQFFSERLSEAYEIERRRLEFEISLFETRIRGERTWHQENIATARYELEHAEEQYQEAARLRLDRLQLHFNRFNNNTIAQRENFNERMERLSPITNNLYAPFDGILISVTNIPDGSSISAGQVFFTIACESSFEFRVNSLPEVLCFGNIFTMRWDCPTYEYYMSFDAIVVSDALLIHDGSTIRQYSVQPLDHEYFNNKLLSFDMTAFDLLGPTLRLEVREVMIANTLILPIRAIRPEAGAEYVIIYDNGRLLKRYITSGFRFFAYAQILMGVEYGQEVVMP